MGSPSSALCRSRYIWWVMFVFYGFIVVLTAGAALNPDVPLAGRVACGAIALVVAAWLIYARSAGIRVDERHLTVRRYSGRNETVHWDEVDRFEMVSNRSFNGGVFIAVVLNDGRTLTTQALCAAGPDSSRGREMIAALESFRPNASA